MKSLLWNHDSHLQPVLCVTLEKPTPFAPFLCYIHTYITHYSYSLYPPPPFSTRCRLINSVLVPSFTRRCLFLVSVQISPPLSFSTSILSGSDLRLVYISAGNFVLLLFGRSHRKVLSLIIGLDFSFFLSQVLDVHGDQLTRKLR